MFCLPYVCATMCMPGACGGQKRGGQFKKQNKQQQQKLLYVDL